MPGTLLVHSWQQQAWDDSFCTAEGHGDEVWAVFAKVQRMSVPQSQAVPQMAVDL